MTESEDPDLAALVPSWKLALRSANLSKNSVKLYARGVAAYLEWCQEGEQVPLLARGQVREHLVDMLDGGLSAATMTAYLNGVKSFARWCEDEEELPGNEVAGITAPKIDEKRRPGVADDDLQRMLATCNTKTFDGLRDIALLKLMRDSGGRAAEILSIQAADMAPARCCVQIHGKGGRERLVPFRDDTATALDRYLRARRRHRHAASPSLWLGLQTPTFGYTSLYNMINRRAQAAGVGHTTAHMWRRTWARDYLDRGGSEGGLMALAGWSSMAMVKHYTGEVANARGLNEYRRLYGGEA